MVLRVRLSAKRHDTLISAYAPTMSYPYEAKEFFYEKLADATRAVPRNDKLILLGKFNARVGRDSSAWPGVLVGHGIGKDNANGTLLLTLCTEHQHVITNTVFQQADKGKTTWMHQRSGHWHLIDYVIVRRSDQSDVKLTRAMRGATMWSDHRLVRCKLQLSIKPLRGLKREAPPRKFSVSSLKSETIQQQLEEHTQQ